MFAGDQMLPFKDDRLFVVQYNYCNYCRIMNINRNVDGITIIYLHLGTTLYNIFITQAPSIH